MEQLNGSNNSVNNLLDKIRDSHSDTMGHMVRTQRLALRLGKKLGLSDDKLSELSDLALIHDIGKVKIPSEILNKPSKLSNEEWEIMKTHSKEGFDILNCTDGLRGLAYDTLCHHERLDGSGYPLSLKGDDIPLLSKIIAVVDSYDAMTSDRCYRKAMKKSEALNELVRCCGSQFDSDIVHEFIEILNDEV